MNKIAEFENASVEELEYENSILEQVGIGIHGGPAINYLNEASGGVGDKLADLGVRSSELFNGVVDEFGIEIANAALYRSLIRAGRHAYLLPDGSGVRTMD